MQAPAFFDQSFSFHNLMNGSYKEKVHQNLEDLKVGPLATTLIYTKDKASLYHYKPRHENPLKAPLLIVFALINKPYILDLMENCSLIQDLLDQGLSIYMIEWGPPRAALSLADYLNSYIYDCVQSVLRHSQQKQLHMMGVCQGGVLSLCYSSLYPQTIRSLITVSTPVDFHQSDNLLAHRLSSIDAGLLARNLENIPGALLTQALLMLNPFRSLKKKMHEMDKVRQNPSLLKKFLRVEKWIHDSPDHAGVAFKEFVEEFYQKNYLIKNKIKVGHRRVNLQKLTMPILNVIAENDSLIPPRSSLELGRYVGSTDYTALKGAGGHISLYINDKTRQSISQTMSQWLKGR